MKISAGYRVESFWNMMPELDESGFDDSNRVIHGPFPNVTFAGW